MNNDGIELPEGWNPADIAKRLISELPADFLAQMREETMNSALDALWFMVLDYRAHKAEDPTLHSDQEECDDWTCPGPKFIGWAKQAGGPELTIQLAAAIRMLSDLMPDDITAQVAAAVARDEARELQVGITEAGTLVNVLVVSTRDDER